MEKNDSKHPPDILQQDPIKEAIKESQLLISYVARYSPVEIDSEITKTLIQSKHFIDQNKKLSPEEEVTFWEAYDKISSTIEPVTIESLKATMPVHIEAGNDKKSRRRTTAANTVFQYRLLTTIALSVLLLFQIYWINGTDLTVKLENLFRQIDEVSYTIEKSKEAGNVSGVEINKLTEERKKMIQEFGAAYQLLQDWNRTWQLLMFKPQFKAEVTNYVQQKYEQEIESMRKDIREIEESLKSGNFRKTTIDDKYRKIKELQLAEQKRKFGHEFDKERNKLFLTRISAEFIIRSLQIYALPLLYGLLGSLIFTLRSLAAEIKNLTYTSHSDTKYRLRISMGMLGGMAIGWFFRPDDLSILGSLSPMTIAFLIGYNVEVLFGIMDKAIQSMSKFTLGKAKTSAA